MNPLIATNHRLPGIRSFLRRNEMFRPVNEKTAKSHHEIISLAHEAIRGGHLKTGDRFPAPEQLAKLTGARLTESLDAVAALLKEGAIRQQFSGRLVIARRPVN